MSDFDTEIDAPESLVEQDELTTLKSRATLLGLTFHPSIGLDKLREKVNAATLDPVVESVVPAAPVNSEEETIWKRRLRLKREALALVRVNVTCMNPAKKEWEGEIFTVGNASIGSVKKMVPFNTNDGWHIPNVIYQMMKERMCQVFYSVRDSRGNNVRKGKLIKEFAFDVLEPLTPKEMTELARRQAIAKAVD